MQWPAERKFGVFELLLGAVLLWFSANACRDAYCPGEGAPVEANLGATLLCVVVAPLAIALLAAGGSMACLLAARWTHQLLAFAGCILWYVWIFFLA